MKHVIVAHGNEHQKLLLRCVEAESEEGQKDRPEQQGKLSIVPKVILYIQIKRVQVLHAGLAPLPILLLERPLLEE